MIENIWRMGIQAGVMILIVLLIRVCLKRYSKIYSYLLWVLVLMRLLCPVFIESDWSLQPDLPMDSVMKSAKSAENDLKKTGIQSPSDKNSGDKIQSGAMEETPGTLNLFPITLSFLGIMKCIWGLGLFAIAGCFLFQYIGIKKQVAAAIRESDGIWRCEGISSPFVMGFFAPRIYMPYDVTDDTFTYILRHEQMHIKHKDHLVRMAGMTAVCLHWWNPLVWYAVHKMNQDMEMFCDEAVLLDSPMKERKVYADILLQFAMKQSGCPAVLSFGETNTEQRVSHILKAGKAAWVISVLISAVISAMVIAFFTVPVAAQVEKDTIPQIEKNDALQADKPEEEVFIETFIDAVRADDRETVAEMVIFPRVITMGDQEVYVENKTEFLEYYDTVFTDSLKETLYQCLDEDIQSNYAGFFLGDGEVWIIKSGDDLYIDSIANEEGVSLRYPKSSKAYYQSDVGITKKRGFYQ